MIYQLCISNGLMSCFDLRKFIIELNSDSVHLLRCFLILSADGLWEKACVLLYTALITGPNTSHLHHHRYSGISLVTFFWSLFFSQAEIDGRLVDACHYWPAQLFLFSFYCLRQGEEEGDGGSAWLGSQVRQATG